jgi:hypothetical protein
VSVTGGRREGNRYGILLCVLVSSYVISAFTSGAWVRDILIALFLVVVLIALRTADVPRRIARVITAIVLAGSGIALALAGVAPTGPVAGAAFTWIALMLLFAVVIIIRRVLAARAVTLQSIYGAISAYMIMGLMFAAGYSAMSKFDGGAFFAGGKPASTETLQYFSFATLTTVGYGDFTAGEAGGRAVAVMEALIGQIFLATLVARLVSNYQGRRPSGGQPAGPRSPGSTPGAARRHLRAAARKKAAGKVPAARSPYRQRGARPGDRPGQ